MSAASALERLIDASLKCAKCGARRGRCSCWAKCRCGWSFETGGACHNPIHVREKAANDCAAFIGASVVATMRQKYPDPMRYASGGFAKTLREVVRQEARAMVLEILATPPEDYDRERRSKTPAERSIQKS